MQVGQPVVALGAPLGLASTVTSGIVSALDRYVPVPGDGVTHHLIGAIQTDAAINPGNSGGALVDCAGRLVGVNAAIATVPNEAGVSGGGSVGLGFAIPVDLAKPIADELIRTGQPGHPTTGLQVQEIPPAVAEAAGTPTGLFVLAVDPGGPGAKAGLQAGDIITQVDGAPAVSSEQIVVATLTRRSETPSSSPTCGRHVGHHHPHPGRPVGHAGGTGCDAIRRRPAGAHGPRSGTDHRR